MGGAIRNSLAASVSRLSRYGQHVSTGRVQQRAISGCKLKSPFNPIQMHHLGLWFGSVAAA
jgi:hypothetical protein